MIISNKIPDCCIPDIQLILLISSLVAGHILWILDSDYESDVCRLDFLTFKDIY